jgi:rhodanese-related sulfurtransferase
MLPVLARAAALVAFGSALGFAVNAGRKDGVHPGSFAVATSCSASGTAAAPATVLAPTEAMRLCGDPGVLVADVRAPERFAAGHVTGAVHLPCATSGPEASRALSGVAGKHTLIVYGDSTEEALPVVESLRPRLPDPGLRVIVLEGGFSAWDRAGLACSSGPCNECKEQASEHGQSASRP